MNSVASCRLMNLQHASPKKMGSAEDTQSGVWGQQADHWKCHEVDKGHQPCLSLTFGWCPFSHACHFTWHQRIGPVSLIITCPNQQFPYNWRCAHPFVLTAQAGAANTLQTFAWLQCLCNKLALLADPGLSGFANRSLKPRQQLPAAVQNLPVNCGRRQPCRP